MQLPLTAVRAGEVTTAMRENLETVGGSACILVQPLFLYESLWCLLLLLLLMMRLRKKAFQGEIFLRYLGGYGLGRFVIQWFRTDRIFFPGTEIDVSLVISGVLFVVCTVIVTVRRIMTRKRAAARKRRIEKDYQAEKEAVEKRENTAERITPEVITTEVEPQEMISAKADIPETVRMKGNTTESILQKEAELEKVSEGTTARDDLSQETDSTESEEVIQSSEASYGEQDEPELNTTGIDRVQKDGAPATTEGGAKEDGQPDQEQKRSSEESGSQSES